MNRSFFNECTVLFFIFLFNFNVYTNDQIKANDNPVEFSSDFEVFLKDLGSILNKSKNRPVSHSVSWNATKNDSPRKTSSRRGNKVSNSQKAALNDVLMMKLVSYYEDKYRLALHDPPMAPRITLGDNLDQTKSYKYILDAMDHVEHSNEKAKTTDITHSNLDQVLNYMENTRSKDATINGNFDQVMGKRPEQVEEVLNVMEDVPPNVGRVQNIIDYTISNREGQNTNKNPNAERIYNTLQHTSPNVKNVHADVNFNIMRIGKVPITESEHDNTNLNYDEVRVVDYTKPNSVKHKNIEEHRPSTRKRIQNHIENKFTNHKMVSNTIGFTIPTNHKIRYIIDDKLPSLRVRDTVEDKPRDNGRGQYDPDNRSLEVGRIRYTSVNRSPEGESEPSTRKSGSPNIKKEQKMDSTRPNVERMRIIIGTSPIDKSTVNMRKNNNDNPISEVIVI